MRIFALVCNANVKGLDEALKTYNPIVSSLYREPIQEDLRQGAPFLIEVNEAIKPWLANQESPWGLYLLTKKEIDFNSLRQHLRHYTYAKIPSEKEPVLFRFYDPRFFWKFTEILDDLDLHTMLGPIEMVASNYQGFKQAHFDERRKKYKPNAKMKGMFLTLTQEQEALIDSIYKEKYQDYLARFMWKYVDYTLLERINHHAELIHVKMLKYQQDVKGVKITHPLDHYLIENYFVNPEARYIYSEPDWYFVEDRYAKPIKQESVILKELNTCKRMGYTDISETLFHRLTDHRYSYLMAKRDIVKRAQATSDEYMPADEAEFKSDIYQLSKDLCDFFQAQGIVDERSVRALVHYINIHQRIYRFKDIPKEWLEQLHKDQNSGEYRARSFLIDQLGYVLTSRELNLLFKEVSKDGI